MSMIIWLILFFIIGLILGSFLNSLIYRLYYKIPLWGFSECPKCKKRLVAVDLVPLFSFLFSKGKCRYCQQKISLQYFGVELLSAVLFALVYLQYLSFSWFLLRDLFIVFVLIFVFVFDFNYYLILDKIIYPSIVVVLLFNLLLGVNPWDLIFGALIGAGFFLILHVITKGRGIGFGDVKLGLLIGFIFGWQLTILVLMIAYIIGGLTAIFLLLSKIKKIGDVLPMGTFLSLAAIIVLLYGDKILNLFLGL